MAFSVRRRLQGGRLQCCAVQGGVCGGCVPGGGTLPGDAAGVRPLPAARGGRRAADAAWLTLTRRPGLGRVEFMEAKIQTFLDVSLLKGDRKLLWVNPDCGLKTREWSQVRPCRAPRAAGPAPPALPGTSAVRAPARTTAACCLWLPPGARLLA